MDPDSDEILFTLQLRKRVCGDVPHLQTRKHDGKLTAKRDNSETVRKEIECEINSL